MTWTEYLKESLSPERVFRTQRKYDLFIRKILGACENTRETRIGDFGFGVGVIAKEVMQRLHRGAVFYLIDNDPGVFKYAAKNLEPVKHLAIMEFVVGDIRERLDLPFLDVAYGHGVLEHFTDAEIHKILDLQKQTARHIIQYVPTDKYTTKSFGDERLLAIEYWRDTFKPTDVSLFNHGYDLILEWK